MSLLRLIVETLSLVLLVLFFLQFRWSRTTPTHRVRGLLIALATLGTLIAVGLRFASQDVTSRLYVAHLVLGTCFFLATAGAIVSGIELWRRRRLGTMHRFMTRAAAVTLVSNLMFGIAAAVYHHTIR